MPLVSQDVQAVLATLTPAGTTVRRIYGHVCEPADVRVHTFPGARQSRFLRILRVEEMHIEVVDSVPEAQVLERGALTECDRDQAITIWPNEMTITLKKGGFLCLRQRRQRLKFRPSDRALDVVLRHRTP